VRPARTLAWAAAAVVVGFGGSSVMAPAEARAADAAPQATLVGGPAAAPVKELTLEQALALARRTNRNLVVERARVAQAQTNLEQAWSQLLPNVALQGKYSHNNKGISFPNPFTPVGTPASTLVLQKQEQLDGLVNFTMPLLAPAVFPAVESVKLGVRVAEENYRASEDSTLFSVAQAFYICAGSDEVLVARHSSVEVTRVTLQNSRTRFAAGAVTKVDVDRAELALVRAAQAEREADSAREQAYRALGTLIQVDGAFRVQIPAVPSTATAAASTSAVQNLDDTLRLRPEFRGLQLSMRSYDAQRRSDSWRWAPSLSAFGNARLFNYENFAGDHYSWVVGAQLDWVIFDGGVRDAQRHLAAAQVAETDARAEVLRDSIRDDLLNGRRQLETKSQAQQAAEQSVALANETIELVRAQYEAGTVTQVDLLQAQDNLVAAQDALAQAHFDVAVADLTLRRTAGTFP
jgi:outer membrane protein